RYIPFVRKAAFDSTSTYLTYSLVDTSGLKNGLYFRNLINESSRQHKIISKKEAVFDNLEWDNKNGRLAFTEAGLDTTFNGKDASLKVWTASSNKVDVLIKASEVSKDWMMRTRNSLKWSENGTLLFFGLMPKEMVEIDQKKNAKKGDSIDIYDWNQIFE